MMRWQPVLFMLVIVSSSLRAGATDARASVDALIQSSVVVGSNRGWSGADGIESGKGVRFDIRLTAARGLILLRAAKVLNEPKYLAAVDGVARALMAAQQRSGYVPAQAVFLKAGARPDTSPSPILARGGTDAAIAFWLAYDHASAARQPRADQAARSALGWITQQQLGIGGFLAPTTQPNTGLHPVRQIDLTIDDYRNTLLGLLLANRLEPSKPLQIAAEKAVNRLLALRLMYQAGAPTTQPSADDTDEQRKRKAALQLWAARYEAAGEVAEGETEANFVASSQALQCLLIQALLSDNPRWVTELRATHDAISLHDQDLIWPVSYPALPTTRPATEPISSVFGTPTLTVNAGTFNLPSLLDISGLVKDLAQPEQRTDFMEVGWQPIIAIEDRMAATICGLQASIAEMKTDSDGQAWSAVAYQH